MISRTVPRGHYYNYASYKNIIQSFFLANSWSKVSEGGSSWTLQKRPTKCHGESSFSSLSFSDVSLTLDYYRIYFSSSKADSYYSK